MLLCTFPANLSGQWTHILLYLTLRGGGGSLLLCNRIPKCNKKPEFNQTQAIYPPLGPKPKVCVTTANLNLFKFNFWQQHKGVTSWIYGKHSLKRDNSVEE